MTRTLFALILLLFSIPATAQPGDDLYEPPEIAVLGRGTALTLDWHPSGEILAVGGHRGLSFYDETFADVAYFDATGHVRYVAWSPTGTQLLTATAERHIDQRLCKVRLPVRKPDDKWYLFTLPWDFFGDYSAGAENHAPKIDKGSVGTMPALSHHVT